MGLVDTVRVYKSIDRYFVAASTVDSKNYLKGLNSPDPLPEEIANELWVQPEVIGKLKKDFIKQIQTPCMVLREFGLYRIFEYEPDLDFIGDEPLNESKTEDIYIEYMFTAENPATALDYLLSLSPSNKRPTDFQTQIVSLHTTITTGALSCILQTTTI